MKKNIYKKFSLPYLITKSARAIVKEYEKEMGKMEISPLQGGVLFVIAELKPINQTEIAKILFIDKVTLSKMLFKLEQRKLAQIVQRSDRRSKYWEVTNKGLLILDKIKEVDALVELNLKSDLKKLGCDSKQISNSLRSLLEKLQLEEKL
jgi:DNA-binding MarR family transcriptional regulator